MLVQQSQAGSIIGRGGSKIKSLRDVRALTLQIIAPCLINTPEELWNSFEFQFYSI